MFEHSSFTYSTLAAEQERVDRANELRRFIAENPSRVVARPHPIRDRVRSWRVRSWFGTRADAAAPSASSDGPQVICDKIARPAHAR